MLLDNKVPSIMLAKLLDMAVDELNDSPELANNALCDTIVALMLRTYRVEPGCPAISPTAYASALRVAKLCLMFASTREYLVLALDDNRDKIEHGSRAYLHENWAACDELIRAASRWRDHMNCVWD